jgi:hypothetical protein
LQIITGPSSYKRCGACFFDSSHENPDEIEKDWKPSGGGVYDPPEDAIGDAPVFNQKHRIKK